MPSQAELSKEDARRNAATAKELLRLGSTNAPGDKESVLRTNKRKSTPRFDTARKSYEDALARIQQELIYFSESYEEKSISNEVKPTLHADYKRIRRLEGTLTQALEDFWPHLEKGGLSEEKERVKGDKDEVDIMITAIKLNHKTILDEFSQWTSTIADFHRSASHAGTQKSKGSVFEKSLRVEQDRRLDEINLRRVQMNAQLEAEEREVVRSTDLLRDQASLRIQENGNDVALISGT